MESTSYWMKKICISCFIDQSLQPVPCHLMIPRHSEVIDLIGEIPRIDGGMLRKGGSNYSSLYRLSQKDSWNCKAR
jgi:hypothetical protein